MNKKYNKNTNTNSVQVKKSIVDYVYGAIEMGKYRYKLAQEFNDIKILKQKKYYVSPNFSGKNCLMIFTTLNNTYYSVILERKSLKYNKSHFNVENVRIIPLSHISANKTIYNGTIFDGKLLKNNKYYITDVYYLEGLDLTNDKMDFKMNKLKKYINKNIKVDTDFSIEINKLYSYNDIQFIVNEFRNSPYKMYGIIFYPEISGTTIMFNNIETKTDNNYINALLMKTDVSDVYETYLLQNDEIIKVGIAYISNLKCSVYCRNIFKKTPSCIFKCLFNNKFNKLEPIEVNDKTTKPDDIEKIITKL